ncbi:MAG: hypothetical protein VKO64_04335 [Candidatus Sericytochromatia bacterium]|nr:hypothetical protein [Candidatus Sericytochromatia bacterium]
MSRIQPLARSLTALGLLAGCGVGTPAVTSERGTLATTPVQQVAPIEKAPGVHVPISRTPRVPGAFALPRLEALVAAAPAVVTADASILTIFPTLGFGGARWIDLYQPFFAGSARAQAFEGMPFGIEPGIFNRMHFLGVNSHFGLYLPYYAALGGLRPFFIKSPDAPFYYYPLVINQGGALTAVTYATRDLLMPYGAAGVCPGVTPGILSRLGWIGARPGVTSHILVP